MKTNVLFSTGLFIIGLSFTLWSCDPEHPNNPNDQEVITSLKITAISGPDTLVFAYSDPDGSGGNAPNIDTAILAPSKIYQVSLQLLDETKNPVDTITHEIEEEAVDHQFFFTIVGVNLSNAYADMDINGHPIGLLDTWTTTTVSTGTVMVTLRHQPGKSAANVSSGDITNAGGETDVEVTFPVRIE